MRALTMLAVVLFMSGCDEINFPGGDPPQTLVGGNTIPQVFDGEVFTYTGPMGPPTIETASAGFNQIEMGQGEFQGWVYTSPPPPSDPGTGEAFAVPDVFLERWLYPTGAEFQAATANGFAMQWIRDFEADCISVANAVSGSGPDPIYAEQRLVYENPTSPNAELDSALNERNSYIVFQPHTNAEVGWMLRLRNRASGVQDHWLLAEDFEPLGDGGTLAMVLPELSPPGTLQQWFDLHAGMASTYTSTTYVFESLSDCTE